MKIFWYLKINNNFTNNDDTNNTNHKKKIWLEIDHVLIELLLLEKNKN